MGTDSRDLPWSVTYHDGSGNGYRFWQEAASEAAGFEFSPVTPETSSSGIYNGGEPKTGQVSAERVDELWRWLDDLEFEDSIRAATRVKGSGAFRAKTPRGTRDFLIENGPRLHEFEAFLKSFQ